MKGIIFSIFNQMVEEKFGLEFWDELLKKLRPKSGGAYTSADNYPDQEFFSLTELLSQEVEVPQNKLVYEFGIFALLELYKLAPHFFNQPNLKEFLKTVHGIIHVEVKKLYPDAILPRFEYEDPSLKELYMIYYSPRKLCGLAEGLIMGASKFFNETLKMSHSICMLNGDKNCRIHLEFLGKNS